MNNSTLAVVVSFHPTEEVVENVHKTLEQVSKVIIVDNESSKESRELLARLNTERVDVIFNEKNLGVAAGFNQGVRWGQANGYYWFLLLDQDSCPKRGMVEKLIQVSNTYSRKGELALIGPHHEDFNYKIEIDKSEDVISTPLLITSGSLFTKDLIDEIGLYDERLFIDHVDHDYCLRLVRRGGKILRVNSATLLHRFGKGEIKSVWGRTFLIQDYSAFRRYHMMRNRIVLYKRYGMFRGAWFRMDLRAGVIDLAKLILFESDKTIKLKSVFKGLWDGLCWRD